MSTDLDERGGASRRVALSKWVRSNPWHLGLPVAVAVVLGLTFWSPLVGVALVVAFLLAGAYVGGHNKIAAVVVYVLMLYGLSPRLALGVYEVTPALLVGLGCFLLWASGRAANEGRDDRASSPMSKVVIAYFCVVLLTYGLGLSQPLLAEQFAGADRNLVKLAALVGVVLLIIDVVETPRQLDQVFGLIVAGGAFVAFATVLQSFFDFDVVDQMHLPGFTDRGQKETGQQLRLGLLRATGTAWHPIELGTALAIVLPIALHFVTYARTARGRMTSTISAALMLVAMVLSLSRSAYIGLFVGLAMLYPKWTSQRRFSFGLMVVPVVFAVAFIAPDAFDAALDLIVNWRGEGIDASNVSARTEDYEIVRQLVIERPWFGRGFGTFTGDQTFAADNQYLSTLIETGLIGTAALLALMGTAYALARGAYRASASDNDRDLAASVGASVVVGVVSFGVFDAMAFDLTVASVFVMFGMVGAMNSVFVLHRSAVSDEPPEVPSSLSGREDRVGSPRDG